MLMVYWARLEGEKLSRMDACRQGVGGEYVGKEHTLWNSFRELVHLEGLEEGVFIPLGRWPGYLGQGLCGHVQLARTAVLEGSLFAYSGAVAQASTCLSVWESYPVKQGVKPDNRQGKKNLTRIDSGTWCQVVGEEGAKSCSPYLRYLGLKLSLTLPP